MTTQTVAGLLAGLMPQAQPAGSAASVADCVIVIGLSPVEDPNGWQALRDMMERFGDKAETYAMVTMRDRSLLEIWFSEPCGAAALDMWKRRLNALDRPNKADEASGTKNPF